LVPYTTLFRSVSVESVSVTVHSPVRSGMPGGSVLVVVVQCLAGRQRTTTRPLLNVRRCLPAVREMAYRGIGSGQCRPNMVVAARRGVTHGPALQSGPPTSAHRRPST